MIPRGDSPGIWLLELSWGGQVYRWSSRTGAMVLEDGTTAPLPGGLDLSEWTRDLEILSTSAERRSIPLSLDWPGVASHVALGHHLDTATGELSYLPSSLLHRERLTALVGYLEAPEYGADGEPVRASLTAEPLQDHTVLPAASMRVTLATWAAGYDTEGETYPIVYGEPGEYYSPSNGSDVVCPGTPARVVSRVANDAQTLLIAGHEVVAQTVTIFDGVTGAGEVFAVTITTDLLGQVVTTVDVSGAAVIDLASETFWAAWHDGRAHPEITGLGSLLRWLLRQSSIPVDERRTSPVVARLDQYEVGGYLSEPCTPWEHAQDLLLDLAGITLVSGPGGVYPVVWDLDATDQQALIHLVAGEGISRASMVRYDRARQDYRSEVRLGYAVPADSGTPRRRHIHTGGQDGDASSPAAIRGYLAYGRQSEEMTSPILWRDSTVAALASRWVRYRALPVLSVDYDGQAEDIAWLADMDCPVVVLTDADVSLVAVLAVVRAITLTDGGGCSLSLVIPDAA